MELLRKHVFFAVLEFSTIDPGPLLLATYQTALQVKWSRPEVLFLLSLYKEKENLFKGQKVEEKNLVGGDIKGYAREREWLLWCTM